MQFGNHTPSTTRDLSRGGGIQWKFAFPNGFGASVINDGYGRDAGLFELAVLDSDEHITYDTPLTDDVLGYLTADEVAEHLDSIAALNLEVVAENIAQKANEERDRRIAALRAELASLEGEVQS